MIRRQPPNPPQDAFDYPHSHADRDKFIIRYEAEPFARIVAEARSRGRSLVP